MKGMFLDEGYEKVRELDTQIQALEEDKGDDKALVELYRIIHSFKGMAGTVELKDFERFFHDLEDFISEIQKDKIQINERVIDLFYELLEFTEHGLNFVEKGEPFDDMTQKYIKRIFEVRKSFLDGSDSEIEDKNRIKNLLRQYGLEDLGSDRIEYNVEHKDFYLINIVMEKNIKLKLARLLVILKNLQGKGEIIKTEPPLMQLLEEKFDEKFQLVLYSENEEDGIKKAIEKSGEIESVKITMVSDDDIKEMLVSGEVEEEIEAAQVSIEKTKNVESVKVDLNLIEKEVELFGELLISTKRLEKILEKYRDQQIKENIFQMQQYMVKLQDIILKTQLVPVSSVFRPFPRMIRMLARRQGKKVNLLRRHNDVKVDRKILGHLTDILNHLVRNAVDHGIETMAQREDLNKKPKATVVIETQIKNNALILSVEDDGRGINPEKIGKLAVQKELFTKEEIQQMSDEQIINLIFSPNFSSAKEITNISGRGMGLNIVKNKIDTLNGSISLESSVGEGTTFRVMLPLSKTLIRALLVRSGEQIYTIALDDIDKLMRVPVKDIERDREKYFYTDAGNTIEIHDLGRLFSLYKTSKIDNEGEKTVNIVNVKKGENYIGLIVDEFIRESEIVIKNIDDMEQYTQGISGAAVLEDGRVSLIINPFTILS